MTVAKVNALCTGSRSLLALFAMAARLVEFIASVGTLSTPVKEDQLYTVSYDTLGASCNV